MRFGRFASAAAAVMLSIGMAAPALAVPNANTDGTTDEIAKNVFAAMMSDHVTKAPRGVNNWSCKLTPEHPKPVVLLHGAYMSMYTAWSNFGPRLADEGYCVYAINYGREEDSAFAKMTELNGTGPIDKSVEQVWMFIQGLMAHTGAQKIDLIGYSEGGLQGQLLTHRHRGNYVDNFISIGGVVKGTTLGGVANLIPVLKKTGGDVDGFIASLGGQGTNDMVAGSAIVKEANAGGDVLPGIQYTAISSQYDLVAYPMENTQFTKGPSVRNIVLQDGCSKDKSEHLSEVYNDRTYAYVSNTLAGKTVHQVPCDVVLPFGSTVK